MKYNQMNTLRHHYCSYYHTYPLQRNQIGVGVGVPVGDKVWSWLVEGWNIVYLEDRVLASMDKLREMDRVVVGLGVGGSKIYPWGTWNSCCCNFNFWTKSGLWHTVQYLTWGRIEASSFDYSFLRTYNSFEASFGFAFLQKSKLLKHWKFKGQVYLSWAYFLDPSCKDLDCQHLHELDWQLELMKLTRFGLGSTFHILQLLELDCSEQRLKQDFQSI